MTAELFAFAFIATLNPRPLGPGSAAEITRSRWWHTPTATKSGLKPSARRRSGDPGRGDRWLIRPSCGDHPYLDYSEIPARLQWLRGPRTLQAGLSAYDKHLGPLPSPNGDSAGSL